MNFFSVLIVFLLCSTFGYLLEVCYRSIRLKRLINPGFLVGCCLPIYGCGGVVLYSLCKIDLSFIQNSVIQIIVFLIVGMIAMTLIEYIAGIICIKVFKNRLWDYSNRKGNIQGIICPLFTLVWGVCCAIFYFLVNPVLTDIVNVVLSSIVLMFFSGMYYGIFLVDLCYSMRIMVGIRKYASKFKEVVNFENFKKSMAETVSKLTKRRQRMFSFKLYTKITKYLESKKADNEFVVSESGQEAKLTDDVFTRSDIPSKKKKKEKNCEGKQI